MNQLESSIPHLKLSDAIEAGWKNLEQTTNGRYEVYENETLVAVCALGAANQAAGLVAEYDYAQFSHTFPESNEQLSIEAYLALQAYNQRLRVPMSGVHEAWRVRDFIVTINDHFKWPKEKVVETVRSWGY